MLYQPHARRNLYKVRCRGDFAEMVMWCRRGKSLTNAVSCAIFSVIHLDAETEVRQFRAAGFGRQREKRYDEIIRYHNYLPNY